MTQEETKSKFKVLTKNESKKIVGGDSFSTININQTESELALKKAHSWFVSGS